jgi:hypothetical protein
MIKFDGGLLGKIEKDLKKEISVQEKAILSGLREASEGLKDDWRKQVISAFNHVPLSKSVRARHYKNQGHNPASYVYTKAPKIMQAFDKGGENKSKTSKYLAIPTENAPKKSGTGRYAKKITPDNWDEAKYGELKFVPPRRGKSALLVVDGYRASYSRKTGNFRGYKKSRAKSRKKLVSVVMFILVERARIPKKLDTGTIIKKWTSKVPELIEKNVKNGK